MVNYTLQDQKARITAVGSGPRGLRIIADRGRTEQVLLKDLLADPLEMNYWLSNSGNKAIEFRIPLRSPADVLRGTGSLTIAGSLLMVMTESGKSFNWSARWYWDPASGRWSCAEMTRKGRVPLALQF
jgi:hypothetical protein